MKQLLKLTFAAIAILFLGFIRKGNDGNVKRSFIDTPKYEYVIHIKISVSDYQRSLDTLQLVLNDIGRSMSVDEANTYRNAAYRQIGRLNQRITLDSLSVSSKQIVEPIKKKKP